MIGTRIKTLRKTIRMTQQEIANEIGLKRVTIAAFESGRSFPSDRTITDICSKFNVNEIWLRDGIGEMFRDRPVDEELSEFFGDVLAESPGFRKAFLSVLSRMTEEEWHLLERKAWELVEEVKKEKENKDVDM